MGTESSYLEPFKIDYLKLAESLKYYTSIGYEYLEVPWVVKYKSSMATLPVDRVATAVQYGDLVGSGEQSFIELIGRGQTITKACCVTPCFRIEPIYDTLHHAYFMKLELINTKPTVKNLKIMIQDAKELFNQYTPVKIIKTGHNMYDIVDIKNNIELGSYGFRTAYGVTFIYGTGIALPRLDTALNN